MSETDPKSFERYFKELTQDIQQKKSIILSIIVLSLTLFHAFIIASISQDFNLITCKSELFKFYFYISCLVSFLLEAIVFYIYLLPEKNVNIIELNNQDRIFFYEKGNEEKVNQLTRFIEAREKRIIKKFKRLELSSFLGLLILLSNILFIIYVKLWS